MVKKSLVLREGLDFWRKKMMIKFKQTNSNIEDLENQSKEKKLKTTAC